MAESSSAALAVAPIPSSADIARAEKLVRERFVHGSEDASVALAPGTARRRALDAALAELGPVARAAPDADEEDEDSYELQDAGELNGDADLLAGEEELEADDELVQEGDEEAPDWVEEEAEEDESLAEQPEDPNAAKRFW